MTWGEFARRADETLVSYEQWWHHYTNGIGQFSGEEYGRILIEFEDTRVVIEAFDSLVRDIKDLIEKYNAVDFPEKLDAFLNEFYNICDQIEVVVGRRITSEQVVIRNVRDHVEYLLDFGNAGTVLTS